MKVRGHYAWWCSEGATATTAQIAEAGLAEWFGTTQYRTYLRKAVDKVRKQYRLESSKSERTPFSEGESKFRLEWIDVQRTDEGIVTSTFSIFVDNKTGRLSTSAREETREYGIYKKVLNEYRALADSNIQQGTEISKILKEFFKRECRGLIVKKGGGMWYIDARMRDQVEFLVRAAGKLGVKINLLDVHESSTNDTTLSSIVNDGMKEQIDYLVQDLLNTTEKIGAEVLDERLLEDRWGKIERLKEQLDFYKDSVKTTYVGLLERVRQVEVAMTQAKEKGGRKATFLELLASCK